MTRSISSSNRARALAVGFGALVLSSTATAEEVVDPVADYKEFCAECHLENRLGAAGPALIPQTLKRMRGPKIEAVIREGRVATQMPGFTEDLSAERIKP